MFGFDSDEMKTLAQFLDDLGGNLSAQDVLFPASQGILGESVVVRAINDFSEEALTRRDGSSQWCQRTSKTVLDVKNQSENTDQQWADSFTFEQHKFQ